MTRQRKSRIVMMLAAAVVVLLLIFLGVGLSKRHTAKVQQAAVIQEGVTYLQTLEQADPAEVETAIKEIRQQKLEAQRQERIRQLTSGEVDVWSLFEDYVLLGDSRAVGFSYYGCMPEARVLAEGGATIRNVEKHLPEIKALNPATIFLCYGLNDVSIGFWPTPDSYAAEFQQVIAMLHQELPNAVVYVSSILPARDPAFERDGDWRKIPDYSAAVAAMCKENGVPFVNNDAISGEHADLWDIDGIHLRKAFYPYWGANLIMAVYENG